VPFTNTIIATVQQNEPNEITDGITSDNTASASIKIKPLGDVLATQVLLDKTSVLPGEIVTFRVSYQNRSSFAGSGLFRLVDSLPERSWFSTPFEILPAEARYDASQHLILLDNLNLSAGENGVLTFKMRVREDTLLCATITSENAVSLLLQNDIDCVKSNNARRDTLTILNPRTETRLALANLDRNAERDRPTDFMINYNSGGSLIPVRNVMIAATLPAGMEFVSGDLTPAVNGQILTWTGLTILPAENKAIRVTVVPRASQPCFADTLRATATITSSPFVCTPAAPRTGSLILPGTDDLLDLRVTATPDNIVPLDASSAPALIYTLTVTNNSQFDAEELRLTDTVPDAKNFMLVSASAGSVIDPQRGVVTWTIPRLNVGASAQFSVQGNVVNKLYCAPDSLVNTVVLVATKLPQCVPERSITKHVIAATRPENQPTLEVVGGAIVLKNEGRSDGAVEPYEPATLCVKLRANAAISNLTLRSTLPNFNGWTASFGDNVVTLAPEANNPKALAPGEEREFCFQVQGPQTISVDRATVNGVLVSDQNCGQVFGPLTFPAKGLPALKLALSLSDASENNLARDNEALTATTTLQHESTSRFNAENVTLHLALRAEAPANIELISAHDVNDIKLAVAQFAVNAPALQWPVKFRYPVLTVQNQRIVATAYYAYFGFNNAGALAEVKSGEVMAVMAIEHPCYARPRTFIPEQHHAGMSFQPNDGQTVTIFDVAGNRIWQGETDEVWRGLNQNHQPVLPGTYVWVISGEGGCKGTIVVLR
ncbi:MAG: hypothetical protein AAB354_03570, partial [candidate division KSB1 bacterium]